MPQRWAAPDTTPPASVPGSVDLGDDGVGPVSFVAAVPGSDPTVERGCGADRLSGHAVWMTVDDRALIEALGVAQRLGMLGDEALDVVVARARQFTAALGPCTSGELVIDVGSGGGVPGLVCAWDRPDLHFLLVERRQTRADHLLRMVHRLGWTDRVAVAPSDVRSLHRTHEGAAAAVTARGYGPPAQLLRDAAPLLVAGGRLIVSEPPGETDRWTALLGTDWSLDATPPDGVACLRRCFT